MNRMARRMVLSAAVLVIPLVARGEEATTGPSTKPSRPAMERREGFERRDGVRGFGRERMGTYNPDGVNPQAPVTNEEQAEVEKFMSTYSPKRWEKSKSIRPDKKNDLLRLMRNQMRSLQRMKLEDPKIYELRLQRLPLEDDIFSLGWQVKHPTEGGESEEQLRAKLRQKIREFVDNSLAEQTLRIEHMQERLRRQQDDLNAAQKKLKDFAARKDAVIDNSVEDVANGRSGALKDLAGPFFGGGKSTAATEPSADTSGGEAGPASP